MIERNVTLNETGLWLLFRGMVCEAIDINKIHHLVDYDSWGFSDCLDMSFEECLKLPLERWNVKIQSDLRDYVDSLSD